MSGFTEKQASDAYDQEGWGDVLLTLETSQAMLPLVERVVGDILAYQEKLTRLYPELDRLDRARRELDWSGRSRRYQLQDEVANTETELKESVIELEALGLVIIDQQIGRVGFPTRVNDRPACFSWQPGDDAIGFWNYAGSMVRHPIPESWAEQPEPDPTPTRKKKRRR